MRVQMRWLCVLISFHCFVVLLFLCCCSMLLLLLWLFSSLLFEQVIWPVFKLCFFPLFVCSSVRSCSFIIVIVAAVILWLFCVCVSFFRAVHLRNRAAMLCAYAHMEIMSWSIYKQANKRNDNFLSSKVFFHVFSFKSQLNSLFGRGDCVSVYFIQLSHYLSVILSSSFSIFYYPKSLSDFFPYFPRYSLSLPLSLSLFLSRSLFLSKWSKWDLEFGAKMKSFYILRECGIVLNLTHMYTINECCCCFFNSFFCGTFAWEIIRFYIDNHGSWKKCVCVCFLG